MMIHSDNIIVPNHQPTTTSHVDTLRSLRVPETIRDSFSPSNLTGPMPSIGMTIRIMDIAPFNNNILRSWYFSYCSQINACIIADDNSFFINKTRVIPFILNGRIINRILQMYLIDRNTPPRRNIRTDYPDILTILTNSHRIDLPPFYNKIFQYEIPTIVNFERLPVSRRYLNRNVSYNLNPSIGTSFHSFQHNS